MNTPAAAIALIKEFEGFPFGGRPYRDAVGVWTIGYGHTAGVGPDSRRLTERQASQLLEEDLESYLRVIEALPIADELDDNQVAATLSFIYNLGPGAISHDTGIGRALRNRQWQRAADEMLRWDRAGGRVLPGLTRRRRAERALFLRPARVNPLQRMTPAERGLCREYDRLLAAKHAGRDTPGARHRRVALRAAMTRRRKAIWHAAHAAAGGWERLNRRTRYRALRARTA